MFREKKSFAGFVASIASFLCGSGLQMSGYTNTPLGLMFLAAGVLLGAYAIYLFFKKPGKADLAVWSQVGRFRLIGAAALWVGEDPTQPLSTKGYAVFTRLKEAVDRGDLHVESLNGDRVNKDSLVTRSELLHYARKIGESPLFLSGA